MSSAMRPLNSRIKSSMEVITKTTSMEITPINPRELSRLTRRGSRIMLTERPQTQVWQGDR